ncbi:MAG TPA: lytic transglycosylase domain-containing protein [Thermoanaerobaculia bacterium]|nr:lytic transglycosylase domain-containing protein [Thermoanaerobaculia bacterium]
MVKHLIDSMSTRLVKARRSRVLRVAANRAVATLALGAALSIGGASEALQGVHFLVQKNLDSVRVVKSDGKSAEVVANLNDGFAANSLFKLSRVLPESFVTQQISLFSDQWLPPVNAVQPKKDLFHTEMARINTAIRQDFFANAVPFGDLIHEKAQKYDVDPALVAAVIETESRFHPKARSAVGARGLMQLMPRTGRWLGATNLYDPEQNVDAGVRYLKYLQERFDGNLKKAIAAYNGGEGNVQRYGGVPPFRETRSYVQKVMSRYEERQRQLKEYERDMPAAANAADGSVSLR